MPLNTDYPLELKQRLLEKTKEERNVFRDYFLTGQVVTLDTTTPMASSTLTPAGWIQLSFPWG